MEPATRNHGIDFLRIVSMMMVIVLHINSMGGYYRNNLQRVITLPSLWI